MTIQSLALRFTNPAQQLVGTQEIPLESIQQPGSKSVAITNAGILAAFNANPEGTIFTPSIAANYGNDESGNPITRVTSPASNIPNFVPIVISVVSIINKPITDTSFNLSSFITTISAGVLSYSSSNPSVASVNSSGQVTLLTEGITTITINVTATAEHMAGSTSTTLNVTTPVVQTLPAAPVGFSVLTDNSDFSGLDFDSGMTTLFTDVDEDVKPITMPNSNFMFNNAAYTTLYTGSNGWFSFGTNVAEVNYGDSTQQPINTFRYFGRDHVSTGSYKFVSNNTRLMFKLSGYIYGATTKTFTIKIIITQSGEIRTNYTLASTITSEQVTIGYIGADSSATSDDTLLTLDGVTFSRSTASNLFSLLNGKSILYKSPNYPTFGPFSLPSHELIYQSQIITRPLTPPTSNSSGVFTFTSSNTAVATISVNNGVSSINVIGGGTTAITATQAASGIYTSSSIAVLLNTVTGTSFSTIWRQLGADIDGEAVDDYSGSSVSLSSDGTTLAIGALYNYGSGSDSGHVRVYIRDTNVALGWRQLGGDINGEAAGDLSGASVSLSSDGNIVAIGAILNDGNGSDSGQVRVYIRDTNVALGWRQLGGDINGEAVDDLSGISVSLSSDGNIVAIGAWFNDGNGSDSGHVRVYIRDTNVALGWRQLGGDINGEAVGDFSGYSISLSSDGTTLAIGARLNDGNGTNSGHVRVYIRDTNESLGWRQLGGDINGEAVDDQSGFSVSLSSNGTTLAVGARWNDGNGSNSSHVRVYIRDTNVALGWRQLGGDIDGEAAYDESGRSVSLSSDGNIVAIGAIYNDGSGSDSGHVRVYIRDTNVALGWRQLGGDINGEAVGDESGNSVSLSSDGTTLAIGAWLNDGNGYDAGHVRVFKLQ